MAAHLNCTVLITFSKKSVAELACWVGHGPPLRLYLVGANRFDADLQHSDPVAASIAPSCCNLMKSVVKGGVLKIFAENDCSGLLRFV